MILQQNSTDVRVNYFYDEDNVIQPIDVLYERHIINPNGLIQLKNIPSPLHTVFTIIRRNGTSVIQYNKVESVVNQYDFMVDYINGILTFHSSQVGKEIQISYTNSIGKLNISADIIFTNIDNQGNIVQTLGTVIDEGRSILSDLSVLGGASKVITELQGYIESARELTGNIIQGSNINTELKKSTDTAKSTNTTLSSTITNANNKISDLNSWVESHGDIVNLDNRVGTAEDKLNTVSASLEQIPIQRGVTLQQLGCHSIDEVGYETFDSGAIIDAYLRNPLRASSTIIFTKGVWKANINNNQSNMTFIFEDGCIIDGTFHIAIGRGKDIEGIANIEYVENVTAIGNIMCTDRVGGYYCRNINIDKITILDTDAKYPNQTAQGGARGVHFYLGTYNLNIGEIIIQNTITYGVAFDIGTTQTEDHWTKNVKVGRIIIEKCNREGIIFSLTKDIEIGILIIKQYCRTLKDNVGGIYINNAKGFIKIGIAKIDGVGSLGLCDGVYINGAEKLFFDNLDILNSNHYGITNTGSGALILGTASIKTCVGLGIYNYAKLHFNKLEIDSCGGQGILSPTIEIKGAFYKASNCTVGAKLSYGYIDNFEASNNTSYGLQIETITNCISFNKIKCCDNVGNNIRLLNSSGFKANMIESIDTAVVAGKIGVNLYGLTSSQIGTIYSEKGTTGISLTNCVNLAINSTSTKENTTGLNNAGGNSNIAIVTRQSNGDTTAESGNIGGITGFKGL